MPPSVSSTHFLHWMPFLLNYPFYPGLGQAMSYAGLHTPVQRIFQLLPFMAIIQDNLHYLASPDKKRKILLEQNFTIRINADGN